MLPWSNHSIINHFIWFYGIAQLQEKYWNKVERYWETWRDKSRVCLTLGKCYQSEQISVICKLHSVLQYWTAGYSVREIIGALWHFEWILRLSTWAGSTAEHQDHSRLRYDALFYWANCWSYEVIFNGRECISGTALFCTPSSHVYMCAVSLLMAILTLA